MDTSRALTGSSQMRSSGPRDRALAMPIRCLCPPENWRGYLPRAPEGRPTISISFSASL